MLSNENRLYESFNVRFTFWSFRVLGTKAPCSPVKTLARWVPICSYILLARCSWKPFHWLQRMLDKHPVLNPFV